MSYYNLFHQETTYKAITFETIRFHMQLEEITAFLKRRNCVIYKINGSQNFVTSDHPVVHMNSIDYGVNPFENGIKDSHTVISFPISSKILLRLYHQNFVFRYFKSKDRKLCIIEGDENEQFIRFINNKQYEQSYEYVYGCNRETLEKI